MAPVTAQVITTLRGAFGFGGLAMALLLVRSIGRMRLLRALVGDERGKALVAPQAFIRDLRGRGLALPRGGDALPLRIIPDARARQVPDIAAEPRDVAPAIVRDTAGGVQLDGLEW